MLYDSPNGVILANRVTDILGNLGGNLRTWAAMAVVIMGFFALGAGFYFLVRWATQNQQDRQQHKYSIGHTIVAILLGLFLVAGGAWMMFNGTAGTGGVTVDDFIGPGQGKIGPNGAASYIMPSTGHRPGLGV